MTLAFGLNSTPWFALLILAIFGVLEELKAISLQTTLQRNMPIQQLPKIYSAQSALISVIFGLASLIFGYITDLLNVRTSFLIAALLLLISALYTITNKSKLPIKSNNGGYELQRD